MSGDEKKDEELYRVDTVPPPAGESDAYNAPTKVGPMAEGAIKEMMRAAEKNVAQHNERVVKRASEREADARRDAETQPPPSSSAPDVPKVYEEDDDEAATMLSSRAKPPPSPITTSDVVDGIEAKDASHAPLAAPRIDAIGTTGRSQGQALLIALIVALVAAAVMWTVFGR